MFRGMLLLLIGGLWVFWSAGPASAAKAPRPEQTAGPTLRAIVRSARHPDLRWPALSDCKSDLEQLYDRAKWQPLWIERDCPTGAAVELVGRLAAADSLGLDPADYDATWLTRESDSLMVRIDKPGASELARFDVALTVAALRFVAALSAGRVSPALVGSQVFVPMQLHPAAEIVDSLRVDDFQPGVLERIQPTARHYQLLKNGLVRYHRLARDTTLTLAGELPRDLKPGEPLPGGSRLRRLLEATGDLPPARKRPKPESDTLYAPDLVEGVKKFQLLHGFEPDGVIYPRTAEELARPFAERVRQIELALERWRWMPTTFNAPPIIVNIPEFRLYAYKGFTDREDDMLTMDVLVGAAFRSETPVFAADMKYLVFRPYWELPADIQKYEYTALALEDRETLEKLGYVLVRNDDPAPLPLTPDNVRRIGRDLRMRQLPGPYNALGLVKFMLPNGHDIYLHDTPVKGLFAFWRRDISHGCVRVSDPVALAAHVLRNQPDWTPERIRQAMDGTEDDLRVDLAQPVPVFVQYVTAAVSENGDAHFYADIYHLDEKLDGLLKKGYPYPKKPPSPERDEGQGRISTGVPTGTAR